MNRSNNARRNVLGILVLLIIVVVSAIFVLSKDFREYLRDYKQFQEYKQYIQTMEEGNGLEDTSGNGNTTGDGPGAEEQQGVSDNQPAVSDNEGAGEEGEALDGSESICDVSGNVLWQANMVSEEEAALIKGYAEERNAVYAWDNSYAKTVKINELDKKILETAACTFPNVQINFVGDSITEGVGGALDANGQTISYVNYVQEALQFGSVLNHGVAGRMVAAYTINTGLSMEQSSEPMFDANSQITVFFAGLNDYLAPEEVKNFGVLNDGTTGGYCGQLQRWVRSFPVDYPNTEFFFVTTYQITAPNPTTKNTNFNGIPTLNDYMEQQRVLAAEYDYPVIDLYSTGFMDGHDAQTAEQFLSDGIHPNDAGYRILGEHIAAEIVLHYLGIGN